jgi:hypothetical protein
MCLPFLQKTFLINQTEWFDLSVCPVWKKIICYFLQIEKNLTFTVWPTLFHTFFQIVHMAILYDICYYSNFLDEENEAQGNLKMYFGYIIIISQS